MCNRTLFGSLTFHKSIPVNGIHTAIPAVFFRNMSHQKID